MTQPIQVALLCGGPSQERGISLNSARSVIDHLQAPDIEVIPIYFDLQKRAYELSRAHMYSNTPSDFDFKIESIGKPLLGEALAERLREMDMVFPAIHGAFGEDGGVQAYLEEIGVPFVGSGSEECRHSFDKHNASNFLAENGYTTLPSLLLTPDMEDAQTHASQFFATHQLRRAIVKPARAGSSVGVYKADTVAEAVAAMGEIFANDIDDRVVVEPFCQGREFTLIILQNEADEPVALLPTEIALIDGGQAIFDYRKKYLPTQQVTYFMPPRFSDDTIRQIQREGEAIFKLFGLRDVVRFDGWVLPDGNIWFSDLNMVSGMEQNSFMFLQAAAVGMGHAGILRHILGNALRRIGKEIGDWGLEIEGEKEAVNVIFGGDSSERQVSLMSGTNVWLKLLKSERYAPEPYLLAKDGSVWHLPYALTLRHTVEEVTEACEHALSAETRSAIFREEILAKLRPSPELVSQTKFTPRQMTLADFIAESELVFIAIHGSIGENGELQAMLTEAGVAFTGSGSPAARLCMDKFATGELVRGLGNNAIATAKQHLTPTAQLLDYNADQFSQAWQQRQAEFHGDSLIIKPSDDGCSSGVMRLYSPADWQIYVELLAEGVERVPPHTFTKQEGIVEMPAFLPHHLLLEEFIATDHIRIEGKQLIWDTRTDWIEITVGVMGKQGVMRALTPSITVASGNVLSLEEKFQGGTGVNITPPPPQYVSPVVVATVRQHIETVANMLGISGFARIDAFMHIHTGDVIIIEANAIPGLTPSTVIYHQALTETPPLYPTTFLETILDNRLT
jgi:D-alanine--D-alanine ligase